MKTLKIARQKLNAVTFEELTLSLDSFEKKVKRELKSEIAQKLLDLYPLAESSPKALCKQADQLKEEFNHCPEIYNLLSHCYLVRKKLRKAEKLILENYERNPSDLLAKVNYADHCLRKKKVEKVPKIFQYKESLTSLFPNRKTFYSPEVLGYLSVMGYYYLALGQKDKALDYCAYGKMINAQDVSLHLLQKKLSKQSLIESIKKALFQKKGAL